MSGDGQAPLMRRLDECLQLPACECCVCLQRRDALRRPARHLAVDLFRTPARSVYVRTGDVYLRSREFAGVDKALHAEIASEVNRPGGANRGDPTGQVESGELLLRR